MRTGTNHRQYVSGNLEPVIDAEKCVGKYRLAGVATQDEVVGHMEKELLERPRDDDLGQSKF